jgi:AcrR family transcriptional regulator
LVSVKWTYEKIKQLFSETMEEICPDDAREAKRRRIVDEAAKLFAVHGYKKTSINSIAQNAEVAKGTVYLYFETKADLMIQVIAEEKKQYSLKILELYREEMSPRERLKAWLRLAMEVAVSLPLVSRLMRGDQEMYAVLAEMNANLRDKMEEFRMEIITEMVDLAAAPHRWTDRELRERALVVTGIIFISAHLAEPNLRGGLPTDRFLDILTDMLVDGIAGQKN